MKSFKSIRVVTSYGRRFYCKESYEKSPSNSKSNLHDLLMTSTLKSDRKTRVSKKFKKSEVCSISSPASLVRLEVLNSGANGAPPSLQVMADTRRYLFNCGEGSQRLGMEHKRKLANYRNIFITSKEWRTLSGLSNFLLTLQVFGVPAVNVHGPPGIETLLNGLSSYATLTTLCLKFPSSLDSSFYEDDALKVHFVPIFPEPINSQPSVSDYQEEEHQRQRTKQPEMSMCYIGEPKKHDEAFVIQSCQKLGIEPDSFLERLRAGKNVNLPDGQVLAASDFTHPNSISQFFIIVDCPTEAYIRPLIMNPTWSKYKTQYLQELEDNSAPKIIVHFTPEKILLDPRYVSWMESFSSTTNHLIMNESCRSLGSEAVHRFQHQLHVLDKKIFPLLYSDCERTIESTNSSSDVRDKSVSQENQSLKCWIPLQLQHIKVPIVLAETMLRYSVRPEMTFDYTWVIRLNPEKYRDEILVENNFSEIYDKYQNMCLAMDQNTRHKEYPSILFLGTSSAASRKTRNVSGILLCISKDTRMLLDCGEGTYIQLLRFYGPHEVVKVLTEIKAIYISHLHVDHHLGLFSILKARKEAFEKLNLPFVPVFVIAPEKIVYWLSVCNEVLKDAEELYNLIHNYNLSVNYNFTHPDQRKIIDYLGFHNIETVSVLHPANAYGVTLEHRDGWKITYSGDTMPCEALVKLGKDSDVCIHEATMEDELARDAKRKQHSTTSDAIAVGEKMNAKFILLTHFSQRYAKVPKIDRLAPNVGIAFDNMLVRLTDLPKLPLMYPLLKCMYSEEYEDMEKRTQKMKYKEERMKTMPVSTSESST